MTAFSALSRQDSMRTFSLKRAIFQSANEEIKSAHGRRLKRLKAGDSCQTGLMTQLHCEFINVRVLEHRHQQQCAQHTEWVKWWPTSGGSGIKFLKLWAGIIKI